jgi:hypothetical protein
MAVLRSITNLLLVLNMWAASAASDISVTSGMVIKSEEKAQVLTRPELLNKTSISQLEELQQPSYISLGNDPQAAGADTFPWESMRELKCKDPAKCGNCLKLEVWLTFRTIKSNGIGKVYCALCSQGYPTVTGATFIYGQREEPDVSNLCAWYSKLMYWMFFLIILASCAACGIYRVHSKKKHQQDMQDIYFKFKEDEVAAGPHSLPASSTDTNNHHLSGSNTSQPGLVYAQPIPPPP